MKKKTPMIVLALVSISSLAIYFILARQNISLPYMSCGGSTQKGLANRCITGFSCQSDRTPNLIGAGGTCKRE